MTTKKLLVLALDRFTDDQVFSWPVKHLGAVVEVYGGSRAPDHRIAQAIRQHQPDVVVWSGVCGGESMPSGHFLRSLRDHCRSAMICWDAGHKDWHPYLEEYKKHDTFDLVAAADGSFDWPRRKQDLPALCPINPGWYDGASNDRQIDLGFCGSYDSDSARGRILAELSNHATVLRRTGEPGPYRDYADFMLQCRATVNVAHSAGDGPMHVKARCVEAAWAGCMLFESKGSPLSKWFLSGRDYREYENAAEVAELVRDEDFTDYAEGYSNALREAMQQYHPQHFWEKVMGD